MVTTEIFTKPWKSMHNITQKQTSKTCNAADGRRERWCNALKRLTRSLKKSLPLAHHCHHNSLRLGVLEGLEPPGDQSENTWLQLWFDWTTWSPIIQLFKKAFRQHRKHVSPTSNSLSGYLNKLWKQTAFVTDSSTDFNNGECSAATPEVSLRLIINLI